MTIDHVLLVLVASHLLLMLALVGLVLRVRSRLGSLWRVFVSVEDRPMDPQHDALYRRGMSMAARLAGDRGISRLVLYETAPRVHRAMIDVSSRGQVTFLLEHMGRHGLPEPDERVVVDLGANDGFQGSHSFNLAQLGWWAVLVEANPEVVPDLRRNAAESTRWQGVEQRVVVIQSAATETEDGPRPLHVQGWHRTGSSLHEDVARPGRYVVWTEAMGAPALTAAIDRALKERGHRPGLPRAFGVLSLDIEGSDFPVLRGVLAAGFRPRYILVEAREDRPDYDALLGPHGYERLAHFHSDAIYWRTQPIRPA